MWGMRLFTLFINYKSGNHYCSVYPSLKTLYGVIRELAEDYRDEIDEDDIPSQDQIRAGLDGHSDDFYYKFSNGTWIHVQETAEPLVDKILDECSKSTDDEDEDDYIEFDLSAPGYILVSAGPASYEDFTKSDELTMLGMISEIPKFVIGDDGVLCSDPILRITFKLDVWTDLCKAPFGIMLQNRTRGGDNLDNMYLEQVEFKDPGHRLACKGFITFEFAQWTCKRIVSPALPKSKEHKG